MQGQVTANRDVLHTCRMAGVLFVMVLATAYLWLLHPQGAFPRDGSGQVVGRDFLNWWLYGKAAFRAQPGLWYDTVAYQQAVAGLLGPGYPGVNWSYPPTVMLAAAPFGLLPYLPALLLWTVMGMAALWFSLQGLAGGTLRTALLLSPAALFGVMSGQLDLFVTALLLAAFLRLDRQPVLAGILIGLVTLKPHVGLLWPVALAASGRWRVFLSAAATALLLGLASLWLFGIDSWTRFLTLGLHAQAQVLADPHGIATPFYPTLFMNLHGAGISAAAAMAVQGVFALAAALSVGWAFARRRDAAPHLLFALLTAASVVALPYLLIYSLLPLCLSALLLLQDGALDAKGRFLARLVYWLPLLQIGLGRWHVPGPALIPPLFLLLLVWRLKDVPPAVPSQSPKPVMVGAIGIEPMTPPV